METLGHGRAWQELQDYKLLRTSKISTNSQIRRAAFQEQSDGRQGIQAAQIIQDIYDSNN